MPTLNENHTDVFHGRSRQDISLFDDNGSPRGHLRSKDQRSHSKASAQNQGTGAQNLDLTASPETSIPRLPFPDGNGDVHDNDYVDVSRRLRTIDFCL